MRKSIVVRYHDSRSHPGTDRTTAAILEHYDFPGVKRYLRQHVGGCLHCLLSKPKVGRQAGQLHPIPPEERPFALIHVDHLGPFVTSSKKNKYVLVVMDNLTRFAILKASRDTKSTGVVRFLNEFVMQYGTPRKIVTERGTFFTSKQFKDACQRHGISHTLNSPQHLQANGMVERLNATLLLAIQASLNDTEGRDWDLRLHDVQRDLNAQPNQTTKKSPFKLLYGYTPTHHEGHLRQLLDDS